MFAQFVMSGSYGSRSLPGSGSGTQTWSVTEAEGTRGSNIVHVVQKNLVLTFRGSQTNYDSLKLRVTSSSDTAIFKSAYRGTAGHRR